MVYSPGQCLGNYRLTRLLGTGGMASVYLAEHVHLGTQAAVKVLSARLERDNLERFRAEARLIARLEHPHIVRVLEFGVEEDLPILVMSYAPGGSLRQHHPTGVLLQLDTIVSYVRQVAQALQYAHDEHVIHRDIKPENMLLGRDNEVLLGDFGLAVLSQSADTQQMLQTAAGTIAYMAPEQIQGQPNSFSDQYALGVVVYEWLCGKRPFTGSLAEIASGHLSVPPPPLREQVPTIPSAVEELVLKTLSKDPHERFATIHAFALALEEAHREASSGQTQLVLSSVHVTGNRYPPVQPLPAQLTSLIGREREVAAACTLLRRPEVRLVTLTGTGGIGKTRLALQLATELAGDFADSLCFVSLAPIMDPDLVLSTVAQALDLKEIGKQSSLHLLQAFLQHRQFLLLLDNFEQVVAAAAQLVPLLQACPRLTVLVTSRTLLRVSGEHHFPVAPLSLPDLKQLSQDASVAQYAAVALFVQRAQALKPDFQLTPSNVRAVAEICVRLDGLPLAIELAAARITLLSPQALLTRLGQRFALLTSRGQDTPARQQTLHNTIAWSYALLDAQEQRLFRWLAVFVGGCTLEAIEAVCSELDDEARLVLEGVASLLDKSLLQQREQEDGEPRFMMLETIREYGLEALAASGEIGITQRVHAAYYLALAETAELECGGLRQAIWLERLEWEHDNLRAAMQWFLGQATAGHSAEGALQLSVALAWFWRVHGYWSEGRSFLHQALTAREGPSTSMQAKALRSAANLAFNQGDFDHAELLAQESLALSQELSDRTGIAFSFGLLGAIAWEQGNLVEARTLTEKSLSLWRAIGDQEYILDSLTHLGSLASSQGEYAKARSLLEESLAGFRELGHMRGTARSLLNLAEILFVSQDDPGTIHSLLEESAALFRKLGDKDGIAFCFYFSGQLVLSQGEVARAGSLLTESLMLFRKIGNPTGIALSFSGLGKKAAAENDYAAARIHYQESLILAGEVGKDIIVSSLEGLASIITVQGPPAWAARLWGSAEMLRETMGTPIPPVERPSYEQSVDGARAQLGEQLFATAWVEGRTMTLEQVLAAQGPVALPMSTLAKQPSAPPASSPPLYPDGLTTREVEVLRLVAQGLTDVQVAEQLVISPRTVNTHLKSIYGKIQVSTRSAATRYAIEHKLV